MKVIYGPRGGFVCAANTPREAWQSALDLRWDAPYSLYKVGHMESQGYRCVQVEIPILEDKPNED